MGSYIIKVAAAPRLIDGVVVHDASYAYKPWGRSEQDDRIVARLRLDSLNGKWMDKPTEQRQNVLIVYHGELYRLPQCYGTLWDWGLDGKEVGKVVKQGRRLKIEWYPAKVSEVSEPTNGS
jgi:hypothetical protein